MKSKVAIALFVVGFGLAPIWVAAVYVYRGSFSPLAGSEYWNAAPWLIVLAVLPSAVTLAIAGATIAVHRRTSGGAARKWRFAIVSFVLLVAAGVGIGAAWWRHYEGVQGEWQLAAEFARNERAIVDVSRRWLGAPGFILVCITRDDVRNDLGADHCAG